MLATNLAVVLVGCAGGSISGDEAPHPAAAPPELPPPDARGWQEITRSFARDEEGRKLAAWFLTARAVASWDGILRDLDIEQHWKALGLRRLCADRSGQLFALASGDGSSEVRYVRVVDAADGEPRWLSVPRHVSTPEEGVAWTWGMPLDAYRPTLET